MLRQDRPTTISHRLRLPFCLLATLLAGCGARVPNLQEIPGSRDSDGLFVKSITDSISCELQDAVQAIVDQDNRFAEKNKARSYPWFDKWGVQGTLTLSVAEKTEINPSAIWKSNPVTSLFALTVGLDGSSKATDKQTTNFYYNVSDLYTAPSCKKKATPIPNFGSLLVSSNLGFREFLAAQFLQVGTGNIQSITKNGITKDVTFEVISSLNVNPAWKLRFWSINPAGNLVATSRDRIHEISVTFGPADSTQTKLVGPAADQALANQIGAAINSRLPSLGQ